MSLPHIPLLKDAPLYQYLRDLSVALDRELRQRVSRGQAVDSVLLVSPAGKVYSVRVADDGTLSTTQVSTSEA